MMLEIALEADPEWDSSTDWQALALRAAGAAVAESAFPQLASSQRPMEISVRLAGDDEVRALNAQWRGKDRPTNVLSFPMVEPDELTLTNVADSELLLGDVILAREVCVAEAAARDIAVEDHAAHLIVHGTLHLLGYDHGDDEGAEDMEAREARALGRLGIANPYETAA
jgi:probable rRNA maturation factor